MSRVSEGETHVEAMRLVCQSLEEHEQQGIEIQWDVLQQQLDQMDVILQGIADQRRDDAEEIETLRKDRDHWRQARQDAIEAGELMKAEIETLRQKLADAQREASDEFTERQVLTAEHEQDAAIWKQQVDGAQAEVKALKTQLDDARVATINAQGLLDAARAEAIEARRQRNEQTDRLNATNAVSVQQRDEIAYLRARLDEERSVSAGLREKLTAAEAAVSLQRAGIERLQAFVGKVRKVMDRDYGGFEFDDLSRALAELDAGTSEPAPETAPDEDDILDRIDGDALAEGITEMVREIVEGRKAKAAGNSSATLNSSAVKDSLTPAEQQ